MEILPLTSGEATATGVAGIAALATAAVAGAEADAVPAVFVVTAAAPLSVPAGSVGADTGNASIIRTRSPVAPEMLIVGAVPESRLEMTICMRATTAPSTSITRWMAK